MQIFLQAILDWMTAVRVDLYVLTGVIAVIWAVSAVITGYPEQPVRALRTGARCCSWSPTSPSPASRSP